MVTIQYPISCTNLLFTTGKVLALVLSGDKYGCENYDDPIDNSELVTGFTPKGNFVVKVDFL